MAVAQGGKLAFVVLVEQVRLEALRRLQPRLGADEPAVLGIGVLAFEPVVHPTRAFLPIAGEAQAEDLRTDRHIARREGANALVAPIHGARAHFHGAVDLAGRRPLGDVAHRAADGALAVQRALGSFQYLDALDVHQRKVHAVAGGLRIDGHLIDVAPHHRQQASRRGNRANLDGFRDASQRGYGKARNRGLQLGKVHRPHGRDILGSDRAHRHGHVLERLVALLGGDDHLLDDAFLLREGQGRRKRGTGGRGCQTRQNPDWFHANSPKKVNVKPQDAGATVSLTHQPSQTSGYCSLSSRSPSLSRLLRKPLLVPGRLE